MLAVTFDRLGDPDVLQLVELPVPEPGPGEILIRVDAAAVNFADVMRRRGSSYPFPTPLPYHPGAEVAGTVAALGDGVDGPPIGSPVFGLTGGDGSTGYAQFAVAAAHSVIPIPEGLSAEAAAGTVVAGLTAMLLLSEVAPVGATTAVFVPAAGGGVGSMAVQLARHLGATTVVAGAGAAHQRDAARALGATHVADTSRPGWSDAVLAATDGGGADVVLEMTGAATFADSLRALAAFGSLVVYGQASGQPLQWTPAQVEAAFYDPAPQQSFHAFNLGLWFQHRPDRAVAALVRLVELVASRVIEVPVGHVFPLRQAADAHRLIEAKASTGKVLLIPW
jgi:NADPH:quinone reductase-like Zn-dependent oxidoreductase